MRLQTAGCLRGLLQSHAKLHPITADRRRDARRSKLAHSRSMRFSFQRSDCVGPGNRVSFKEGNAFIGGPHHERLPLQSDMPELKTQKTA